MKKSWSKVQKLRIHMLNEAYLVLSSITSVQASELHVNQMSCESITLWAKEFRVCLTGSCKLQAQSASLQVAYQWG